MQDPYEVWRNPEKAEYSKVLELKPSLHVHASWKRLRRLDRSTNKVTGISGDSSVQHFRKVQPRNQPSYISVSPGLFTKLVERPRWHDDIINGKKVVASFKKAAFREPLGNCPLPLAGFTMNLSQLDQPCYTNEGPTRTKSCPTQAIQRPEVAFEVPDSIGWESILKTGNILGSLL